MRKTHNAMAPATEDPFAPVVEEAHVAPEIATVEWSCPGCGTVYHIPAGRNKFGCPCGRHWTKPRERRAR